MAHRDVFLCWIRRTVLCLFLSAAAGPAAEERAGLLFYAPFDGSAGAATAVGSSVAVEEGSPSFISGVKGQAVVVGGERRVLYSAADNVRSEQGSCTFWAANLDWTAGTPTFQFMASVVHERPNTDLLIYKPHNKTALTFLVRNQGKTVRQLVKPIGGWQAGDWHHVACTWDDKVYRFYVDGRLVAERDRIDMPVTGWRRIVVGTAYPHWAYLGTEQTAVDELRFYDRALTAEEIRDEVRGQRAASPILRRRLAEQEAMLARIRTDNLALASRGAAVITSSFADYRTTYSDNLIDGDFDSAWRSFDDELPQWVELRWAYPVRIDLLEVHERLPSRIGPLAVQAWAARGAWEDLHVRRTAAGDADPLRFRFDEVTTARLRLMLYANDGPYVQFAEIGVYGPEQINVGALRPFWRSWHIWSREVEKKVLMEPRYFRREFDIPGDAGIVSAFVQLYTNDLYEVLINGRSVAKGFKAMAPVAIGEFLVPGRNCVAVVCTPGSQPGWPNMALTAEVTVNTTQGPRFCSADESWRVGRRAAAGWDRAGFDDSTWESPLTIAEVGKGIWGRIAYEDCVRPAEVRVLDAEVMHASARPGDTTRLRLRLRPVEPLRTDYVLVYELGEKAVLETWGDYTVTRGTILPEQPTTAWSPAGDVIVDVPLSIPRYAPHGRLPIRMEGLALRGRGRLVLVKEPGVPLDSVAEIRVDRFGHDIRHPPRTRARVDRRGQSRAFVLGGTKVPPFIHAYLRPTYEKIHLSAQTGTHLYQVRGYPLKPEAGAADVRRVGELLDQHIRSIVRVDEEARFIVLLDLRPSTLWLSRHASARLVTAFGKTGPQSYFSPEHEAFVKAHLRGVIRRVDSQPYAGRVVAWHLVTCGTPDSALGGISDNLWESDRGKLTLGDYNPSAIAAYREWLRARYGDDSAALRRAWRDPEVTFETAAPDNSLLTAAGADGGIFRDPAAGTAAPDYFRFLSGAIWRFYRKLAACVKEETGGKVMVGGYYGYNVHHLTGYNGVGSPLQNNNFDDDEMLEGDILDYVAMVPSYGHRLAGSHFEPQYTLASHSLYRQAYICEIDTRTHTAAVGRHGRQRSLRETVEVLKRDTAALIMEGQGGWFADWSVPGTRGIGYFVDPYVRDVIRRATRIYRENLDTPREPAAQIAVLISGEAYYHQDVLRAPPLYNNLIRRMLDQELPHIGAPYDVYRLEDLGHETVRRQYRLYIMINPFVLSEAEREAVAALKQGGKTVLWFYAPGYVRPGEGLSVEGISEITGIRVSRATSGSEPMAYRIVSGDHPLTEGLAPGKELRLAGYSEARSNALHPTVFQPVFQVADEDAAILGVDPNGRNALAARDFGEWRSVYSAVPYMDRALLRNVARWAGVHLYCAPGPVVRARGPFLLIHKGYGQPAKIEVDLRRPATVTDLFAAGEVSDKKDHLSLDAARCATFFLKLSVER